METTGAVHERPNKVAEENNMRISKSEREKQKVEAVEYLRSILPAGSTVSLVLTHVSRSGMSRAIKCLATIQTQEYAVAPEEVTTESIDISWYVAHALGYSFVETPSRAVRIGGCGMDMGLALIDSLSYALYGKPCDQTTSYPERSREPNGGIGYKWL